MPRILLAHDWLCGYRGGEAVLERLARLVSTHFTPGGLLTMFDDARDSPDTPTINAWRQQNLIHASILNDWPGALRLRRWLLPAYPIAIHDLSQRLADLHAQEPIDLVISTSSSAIKSLKTPLTPVGRIPHLCYCFAPARYLWSQSSAYTTNPGSHTTLSRRTPPVMAGPAAPTNPASHGGAATPTLPASRPSPTALLRGLALNLFGPPLRAWDRRAAANVTRFIAISNHIVHEIARAYDRSADLIRPPTRTNFFTPSPPHPVTHPPPQSPYWLYVGALEPYKRVDLAIAAATLANKTLLIAGQGSESRRLRALADLSIRFLGRVSNDHLRDLYRGAEALIFPQIEDYGIVAVEALACGCPVLARAAGGALDIITHQLTGALFTDPTPESIVAAARLLPKRPACEKACRAAALRLDEQTFDTRMLKAIQEMLPPFARKSGGSPNFVGVNDV